MAAGLLKRLYYGAPLALRHAILIARRADVWRNSGILFIHIPKAGGTSWSLALHGQFMGHIRASNIKRWAPADIKRLPSFAMTRNPWDRLVSAFRFSMRLHKLDWKEDPDLPRFVRRRIPKFKDFRTFVTEWLQHRDVEKLNPIFQPQWRFVCDSKGDLLVDHVGRLDDVGPTLDFIREKLGRTPELPNSNRSGVPVDYRTFYTPELIEIVGRIYEEDVQTFGYTFDDAFSGTDSPSRAANKSRM